MLHSSCVQAEWKHHHYFFLFHLSYSLLVLFACATTLCGEWRWISIRITTRSLWLCGRSGESSECFEWVAASVTWRLRHAGVSYWERTGEDRQCWVVWLRLNYWWTSHYWWVLSCCWSRLHTCSRNAHQVCILYYLWSSYKAVCINSLHFTWY